MKSIEFRAIQGDCKGLPQLEVINVEELCHYKFCALLKNNMLSLQLDGIRFVSARDLSNYLGDLNSRILQTLDI